MQELKNKTVLIADDDNRNIYALSAYLELLEMKVVTVPNGKELISLLESGAGIDIILLDMMMPVMDGYETMSVLKENNSYKHIPVIAVTAKAMKGDKEKCMAAGAWDYIAKPLNMKQLVGKIESLILQ